MVLWTTSKYFFRVSYWAAYGDLALTSTPTIVPVPYPKPSAKLRA
jgi:hypothetical protein